MTLEDVDGSAAARIVSLRDDAGRPTALLSARVHGEWVGGRLLEWLAGFGASSLAICVLALAVAALLAARIARPFAQVARDAERLGGGDLATPVVAPATFLAEPVALATSLERMRAQVARLTATERSQREELDAVLDGVDEGIVGVDAHGRIHYANAQFLALVGRGREDVLAQPVDAVLLPMRAATGGNGLPPLERYTPPGMLRPLILRRLAASGDRQVLVVREENAIEAARAMRDRILANLSHEFQTPLSAQIASIELLRDHLRDGSDAVASRLADAQYRGTMRLSQLVENLLESVRIESGEMRLRRQPVDLAAVVAEAVDLIQPLVDQRDQRIVRRLSPGPLLTGDPPRLFSVMVNLLANANKFAPDQTTIWVDMDWAIDRVTVWVEDEGPGLPPQQAHGDLFAPFRRSPREEPSQRGTGLGLAIAHAVVAAHGGRVQVAPPVQRHGARIGIELPLETKA
jgi:signal transduction histidine kinase